MLLRYLDYAAQEGVLVRGVLGIALDDRVDLAETRELVAVHCQLNSGCLSTIR